MRKVISAILLTALLFCLIGCGSKYEDRAVEAAKKYVSSQFYSDFGEAADKMDCEVIYGGKDGSGNEIHLIGVRCHWNGVPTAAYCVYARVGSFRNATNVLPSGYNFSENVNTLKAMFGIF